ncbi:MAG: photosynthetic protein synthase I [Gammaproteobacteria bacterium]|nr:photosynthetic protein synthase I [Gammaproteobacteria bacterium]
MHGGTQRTAPAADGFIAPIPGSYELPVVSAAADGAVLDDTGATSSLHAIYDERIVLLSFVFTHCVDPDGCPLASFVLSQVGRQVLRDPALRSSVRLVTFSFDPVRDTPAVLAAYAKSFRRPEMDWKFVTTKDEAALAPILASYGQTIQRDPDGYAFSHQLRVFLLDSQGQIRNEYSAAYLRPEVVLADLKTLTLATPDPTPIKPQSHLARAGDDKTGYENHDYQTQSRAISARGAFPRTPLNFDAPPLGLPPFSALNGPVPLPSHAALGRRLFFDRRLSHNDTIACASCHLPDQGFTNQELKTPIGIEGRSVKRNAPSLFNVGYQHRLFHDARESRLEQQVWGPLLAMNEMGNPAVGFVLDKVTGLADYAAEFARVFPDQGITMETLGAALAAYQRTLVSGNSVFDRWYFGGDTAALAPSAQRGFELFRGKARCVACHTIDKTFALLTDRELHNTGLGFERSMRKKPASDVIVGPGLVMNLKAEASAGLNEPPVNDLGRYEVTQEPSDRWKFRTPSLRNVAHTAPYMHDGSLATLADVVRFYNQGGIANEGLDPKIAPLYLTNLEIGELVAFLNALTGDNLEALTRDAFAQPIGDRH